MAQLDETKIRRLVFFERTGYIATAFCGIVSVAFAVLFAISQTLGLATLRIISLTVLPALLVIGIAAAAYLHLKFGGAIKREIDGYVQSVFIENAALLHPEKSELSFGVGNTGSELFVKVNNYKELIKFDFSAFGKLTFVHKSAAYNAVADRISTTFCKLYERGAKYSSVSYYLAESGKKKQIFVIEGGEPNKRAFRQYLKAGNR